MRDHGRSAREDRSRATRAVFSFDLPCLVHERHVSSGATDVYYEGRSSDLEIHRHNTSRLTQEAEPAQVASRRPGSFRPAAFAGLQLKAGRRAVRPGRDM